MQIPIKCHNLSNAIYGVWSLLYIVKCGEVWRFAACHSIVSLVQSNWTPASFGWPEACKLQAPCPSSSPTHKTNDGWRDLPVLPLIIGAPEMPHNFLLKSASQQEAMIHTQLKGHQVARFEYALYYGCHYFFFY